MNRISIHLLTLIISSLPFFAEAQLDFTKIDSLITARENPDLTLRQRLDAQKNIVSLKLYSNLDEGYAEAIHLIEMSQDTEELTITAYGYNCLTFYYQKKEMLDSTEYFFIKQLNMHEKIQIFTKCSRVYKPSFTGRIKRGYNIVLEGYLSIIDSAILHNEKKSEARCRINTGAIYNIKRKISIGAGPSYKGI